jgi:2-keto-myo-inositol isomerase
MQRTSFEGDGAMIDPKRFALNRIAAPALGLSEFFALAASAGMIFVELRNDIRDGAVLDGLKPHDVHTMAKNQGIKIATINAVQKFNLASTRKTARDDLEKLLDLSTQIDCKGIVLCPNNDPYDTRPVDQRFAETVEALVEFGHLFEHAGVYGLVEPLGFGISSLSSVEVAWNAIKSSGFDCYKVVVDTFHYYLGPDNPHTLAALAKANAVGLIHVSGVETDIPQTKILDAHRILPGPNDIMKSFDTIRTLDAAGYRGLISFEPFAKEVQDMSPKLLATKLKACIENLSH